MSLLRKKVVALKKIRLMDMEEGVPSTAIREVCLPGFVRLGCSVNNE
jgi:hypothetical protein